MAKTMGSVLKEKKTISINTYLLNQSNDLIQNGEFSSLSDLITTAVNEFFTHRRIGQCGEMHSIMTAYLQTDEGRALIKSVCEEDDPVVAEIIEEEILQ